MFLLYHYYRAGDPPNMYLGCKWLYRNPSPQALKLKPSDLHQSYVFLVYTRTMSPNPKYYCAYNPGDVLF